MNRFKRLLTAKNLLYLGLFCILLFPWLFTRSCGLISFDSNTGVIADTIGGITAPICGFLGAALVYLALKEQVKANNLIIQQFEHQKRDDRINKRLQYITDQMQILREDIKELTYTFTGTDYKSYTVYSKDAIRGILSHNSNDNYHNYDIENMESQDLFQIQYFLQSLYYLVELSEGLDEEDQNNMKRILKEIYRTKLFPALLDNESRRLANVNVCEVCNLKHPGLPEYIYKLYDLLNKKIPIN